MTKTKTGRYVVNYERDDDDRWTATIDRKQGVSCVTQGRSLAQARKRIREALGAYLDDDRVAADADLVDNVILPPPVQEAIAKCIAAREAVEAASEKAFEESTKAARRLAKAGVSRRDAAALLGISFQRVHQLVEGQDLDQTQHASKPSAMKRSAARRSA